MKEEMDIIEKAELAMEEAIRRVVAEHKRTGRSLAVWEDGKVKWISPYDVLRI